MKSLFKQHWISRDRKQLSTTAIKRADVNTNLLNVRNINDRNCTNHIYLGLFLFLCTFCVLGDTYPKRAFIYKFCVLIGFFIDQTFFLKKNSFVSLESSIVIVINNLKKLILFYRIYQFCQQVLLCVNSSWKIDLPVV